MSEIQLKIKEIKHNWRTLLAATFGCALGMSSLPFYSLGSFIKPLELDLGWTRSQISSAFLYTTLTLAIISPFLGYLIDRFGVRRTALLSIPASSAVLFGLSQYSGAIYGFYILYGCLALLGGATSPINYTRAVNAVFDKARGLALGISLAGIGITAMGLPLLLNHVMHGENWRNGYFLLACLALIPFIFVFFGIYDSKQKHNPIAVDRDVLRLDIGSKSIACIALKSRIFWTIGFCFCLVAIAVSAIVIHLPPLLLDAGLLGDKVAKIVAIIGIGVLIGRLIAGYLIDRLFAPYVAAFMFVLTALGCLVQLIVGADIAFLSAFLIGISLGAEVDLIAYLIARYFGMQRYGFLYAIAYSMFAVGAAMGPTVAGFLYDINKNYNTTLIGVIVILVLSAAIVLTLPSFTKFAQKNPIFSKF